MAPLPPPPVPQKLRDLLQDYPDLIQRLQEVLDDYFRKPDRSIPFDGAIWALEGRLGSFISEARVALKTAEAGGDQDAIRQADEKLNLMFQAASKNGGMRLGLMDEIAEYCEAYKRGLR